MKTHLRSVAKRKVSDFLLREEGMVGNRSAFATAALVSTTALAMTLLVAPSAEAGDCGNACDPEIQVCCGVVEKGSLYYKCFAKAFGCP